SIELEPASREAIRAARQLTACDASASPDVLRPELIGRESAFAELVGSWDRVRRGQSKFLHIDLVSDPGIGKTRLLEELEARLRGARNSCAVVRPNPADRGIPYAFAGELAAATADLPGAKGISTDCAASLVALNPVLSSRFAASADSSAGEE